MKKQKTLHDVKEQELKNTLVDYYSIQLTEAQNKDVIKKIAEQHKEDKENIVIEVYTLYKNVLVNISKINIGHLLAACSLIENTDDGKKYDALIYFCNKLKIKYDEKV